MKLLLSILSFACILSACNTQSNSDADLAKAKQNTIDSLKFVMAKKAIIDSVNTANAQREEQLTTEKEAIREEKARQVVVNNNIPATPAKKKKKWNNTAKGAVIGAGTGAITGALVDKKRGEGALVGGLIGGGVGAATGAIVDHSKKKKAQAN